MAKKKGTLGKLLAFTTTIATIGGVCYIFRDKIKQCPAFQTIKDKLSALTGKNDDFEDDFFFDDDNEDDFEDNFEDAAQNREYTSITINAKDPSRDNAEADAPLEDADSDTAASEASDHTDSSTAAPEDSDYTDSFTAASEDSGYTDSFTAAPEDSGYHSEDAVADSGAANQEVSDSSKAEESVIPTIIVNELDSASPSADENEGLSDFSDDPDVLEEQDRLDF